MCTSSSGKRYFCEGNILNYSMEHQWTGICDTGGPVSPEVHVIKYYRKAAHRKKLSSVLDTFSNMSEQPGQIPWYFTNAFQLLVFPIILYAYKYQ